MTRVVLVDDHCLMREGIRRILESTPGFEVVGEADDGRTAVELCAKLKPDLAVMDIWLPSLSGIEATRQIRQAVPGCRILIVSQHDRSDFIEAALNHGANGYVLKTTPGQELLAAVRAVCDGKCYLSPDVAQKLVNAFTRPAEDREHRYSALTAREREILQLIAEGMSSKEVAADLRISTRTVEAHRNSLMSKLGIHKVASLVRYAVREGIVAP